LREGAFLFTLCYGNNLQETYTAAEEQADLPNIEWFSVKIDLKASYVVMLPAGDEQEAVYEAYNRTIPVNQLYEVEKDAVRITKMKVN
jgi:hypothetical protein